MLQTLQVSAYHCCRGQRRTLPICVQEVRILVNLLLLLTLTFSDIRRSMLAGYGTTNPRPTSLPILSSARVNGRLLKTPSRTLRTEAHTVRRSFELCVRCGLLPDTGLSPSSRTFILRRWLVFSTRLLQRRCHLRQRSLAMSEIFLT
jgi:hypothetical protein